MTKKISVSLPDEVAERLEAKSNVSAYVASSLQMQYAREDTERMHALAGIVVDEQELAEVRARTRVSLAAARDYWAGQHRHSGIA